MKSKSQRLTPFIRDKNAGRMACFCVFLVCGLYKMFLSKSKKLAFLSRSLKAFEIFFKRCFYDKKELAMV